MMKNEGDWLIRVGFVAVSILDAISSIPTIASFRH
jgi:hypothetical protein